MTDWITGNFNTQITVIRFYMGAIYLAVGLILIFRARKRWFTWPVSALVCLGISIGGAGVVFYHQSWLRRGDLPWPLGVNDIGTLIVGVILSVVTTFLGLRIVRNRLLSDGDRQKVKQDTDRASE